ncbi:hypothetical protein SCHPADRAFT_944899 [Schizopora paradoxa]|uniref:Uncharacterized protein n=1 Tax=Schizopora paradoxa TaxID=27342 RepID=A0A0H2RSV6_9AGAM|nr:hypothetical protein SCHPADRAFT_944899 [Schizopora paradoxa]
MLDNDDMWIAVVILVCCESLALGLLLFKSTQHARALRKFDFSPRNILAVMARDGIWYFACTLGQLSTPITIMNLIMIAHIKQTDLRDLLLGTQGAVQNILCSRLLFHIQAIGEPSNEITTPFPNPQSSDDLPLQWMQGIEMTSRNRKQEHSDGIVPSFRK